MIPRLLEGVEGYGKENINRLKRKIISDVAEEAGKYRINCVTTGRKGGSLMYKGGASDRLSEPRKNEE